MLRKSWIALALWIATASVQAGVPSIGLVAPGVGQRGTEFEITVLGAGMNDVAEVLLYRTGLTCVSLRAANDGLTIRLSAATDCPLGAHPFRLRSPRGVSELRTISITRFPLVAGTEPNETPDNCQVIHKNVTVTGIAGADDTDCYRVTLRAGEHLAAEVEAVRLGGPLIDTILAVYGPNGAPLAYADDTPLFGQDPFVSWVAPADGDYTIVVAEANRDGDEQSRYALHVGDFPRSQAIYPAGGQAGSDVVVQHLGDARGAFEQIVSLPAGTSGDVEFYAQRDGGMAPTSQRFRVSAGPNVLEAEPNDAAASNPAIALPRAFNGIVQAPEDVDRFALIADAGDTWRFELFSDRIGSTLDAVMSVETAGGRLIARADDWESHDGCLDVTFPDSGEYVVTVADKRGFGHPHFVYRIEVNRAAPKLTAFMPRPDRLNQEWQSVVVPRGNRVLACLGVQRQSCHGDVELAVSDVPGGVTTSGGLVAADRYWTPVVFSADADAPLAGALASVRAISHSNEALLQGDFRQVVDLVAGPADALYHSIAVNRLAVAVTNAAPVRVTLEPPTNPLSQGGTLSLRVQLERSAGFDNPVDIVLPLLPPWVDGPASVTIPPGQTSANYILRAWPEAMPRTWTMCAEARPGRIDANETESQARPMRRRRSSRASTAEFRVASELIELTISPAPITAEPVSAAGEQGTQVPLAFQLEVAGELPSQLTATLEGLPNRVAVEPVQVPGVNGPVKFTLRLDPTAPLGEFPGLGCRLSGEINGQPVSYVVGRNSTLNIAAPGELVLGDDGRPLSKLESLRRKRAQQPAPVAGPTSAEQ